MFLKRCYFPDMSQQANFIFFNFFFLGRGWKISCRTPSTIALKVMSQHYKSMEGGPWKIQMRREQVKLFSCQPPTDPLCTILSRKAVRGKDKNILNHFCYKGVKWYILQDISKLYQIFPDDILGSGQFGTVYVGKYVWN